MTLAADLLVRLGTLELRAALTVGDETVAVVGPNAAGKTTLLRAIAGLVPIDEGSVRLAGRTLADTAAGVGVPPEQRRIGMVFQDTLLFPHLSVVDNVAFGLRAAGVRPSEARAAATEWLERMGIAARAGARPSELSGGEVQRVGLARAVATNPDALLLDESLSSLDVDARLGMRRLLQTHLRQLGKPVVVVTHDVVEAATLANRIIVLEGGRVVQDDTVEEITRRPRSPWAAQLLGRNLYRGVARGSMVTLANGQQLQTGTPGAGEVFALVPPEAVRLSAGRLNGANTWRATLTSVDTDGSRARIFTAGSLPAVAEVPPAALRDLDLAKGAVWVTINPDDVVVYPA